MMKAFIVDRYNKTGVGRIGEFADPTLGADDVLVEVHAAGINLLDSKIRNGEVKLFCLIDHRSCWGTMWLVS